MSTASTPVPSLTPESPVPSLTAGSPVDSLVDSQANSQSEDGVDNMNSQGSNPGDVPIDLGAAMLQSPIIRDRRRDTLLTTATLNAMHPDLLVVRHPHSGAVNLLAEKVNCAGLNAGDGRHEHPTQALLDALTIRRAKGRLHRLSIAICGDIAHARILDHSQAWEKRIAPETNDQVPMTGLE